MPSAISSSAATFRLVELRTTEFLRSLRDLSPKSPESVVSSRAD